MAAALGVQRMSSMHSEAFPGGKGQQGRAEPLPAKGGRRVRRASPEVFLESEQLSPLASLHHNSEYSRLKFGPNGANCTYVPMSIHLPDHVAQMKRIQSSHSSQKSWWLSNRENSDPPLRPYKPESIVTEVPCSDELTENLHAALTSPLDTRPKIPQEQPTIPSTTMVIEAQPPMRTSDTHPINISSMIPPELLQIISTRLSHFNQDLPVIFDVPFSCQLHRLLFRSHDARALPRSAPVVDTLLPLPGPRHSVTLTAPSPPNITSRPTSFVNLLWSQTFLRKAVVSSSLGNRKGLSALRHSVSIPHGATVGDSKIAMGRPGLDLSPNNTNPYGHTVALPITRDSQFPDRLSLDNRALKRNHGSVLSNAPSGRFASALGNLLLSSCPGKKVRLNGPVKGRGAVCRDLTQDLIRISEMGVRCIVCCLDDSELGYLGAPWPEYARTADELGLDVLRIPLPEGLVPLDVEKFDADLTRLIDRYTLTGRHVLVHCRGGVGRAGLIACCWTLKLGLCGWIETESRIGNAASVPPLSLTPVKSDTLLLVQRLLAVVRKQRSPKAIETFEQVKFLTDFVEHLRKSARKRTA
ncbi:phosphatases II [Cristinia sonorae]|uniref:Phosphatases II n=1 Tax=Cristinia sonorae TaxID=1940300 RepID=A0A8K0UL98_9AGAR|nr:phosphatases II [Cristinia sonorae]